MAIHRAAYVADPRTDHGGRTLLVTFNRAFVTYLEHLPPTRVAPRRHPGRITTSRGVISNRVVGCRTTRSATTTVRETIISEAIAAVGHPV